jgi:formate/nitrite transporter FocA (FNT family)
MARKNSKRFGARKGITEKEVRDVEEMSTPRTPVIYEVIRRQGTEEIARPAFSLWWSGVAGGLSISFSLLAMAILETHLPEAGWRVLVTSLGYTIGFLIVILGRQQLFTESTITAVLPVLKDTTPDNLWQMARLWAIVLAANLTGTLFAAIFCSFAPVLPNELLEGMRSISRHSLNGHSWWEMVFEGVSSGFLMAAMVWMIPAAEMLKVYVIVLMTWLIAVGGFTHIVAGSVEAFVLLVAGEWSIGTLLWQFLVPVLIGNIIGGTALFALLSYAQVKEEI